MHKAVTFTYCFSNQYLVQVKKLSFRIGGVQGRLKVGTWCEQPSELIPRIKHNITEEVTRHFL